MRASRVTVAFLLVLSSLGPAPAGEGEAPYQFALLLPGPDRSPLGEREIQALQEAHLEYLRDEIDRGTIVLAGRLDSGGGPRSAVLLAAEGVDEARAILERDPWVRAGRVTPEVTGWSVGPVAFGRAPDVLRTERIHLALYRRPDEPRAYDGSARAEIEAGHREAVRRFGDPESVLLQGPIAGESSLQEVVVLREADLDRILDAVRADPYLTMGVAGFEIYPWHVPHGAVP